MCELRRVLLAWQLAWWLSCRPRRLVVLGTVGACCSGLHVIKALVVVGALVLQGLDLGLRGSDIGANPLGAHHGVVVDLVRRFSAHAGVGC